jgi:hypothetical protein
VELAADVPYFITLENPGQYTGIAWYINGTKSAVTGSKLSLDTGKTGPAQVTVEAYKEGTVFDTGIFRFKVV